MRESPLSLNTEETLFVLLAESVSSHSCKGEVIRDRIVSLLENSFDWDYFVRLAAHHDYLAASYRFFTDHGIIDELPAGVKSALEREYLLAQARFAKKESELLEIVRGLENRDIEPIVFKGIPQAYRIYEDPGIRVSKDIDIIVTAHQVDTAKQVLLDKGYTVYSGLQTEQDLRDYHFHLILTRGERMDVVVEVHWTLLDPKKGHAMNNEALWKDTAEVTIHGKRINTLRVPHVLWNISMQLSYKSFLDFRSLVEIKRLAGMMDDAAWNTVFEWAADSETTNQLMFALGLSETMLGRHLPPHVRSRVNPGFFLERFIKSTYYPRGLVWNWVPFLDTHELIVSFVLRNGVRERVRFLRSLLFPDRRAIYEIYPGRIGKENRFPKYLFSGCYVFAKVILLSLLLGFMIRTGILGEGALDPTRHI